MTIFESKAEINKPVNDVYAFLSDMNNHEKLMPENISNWSSSIDHARFSIQNMGNLSLLISNRIQNSSIIIIPAEQAPFGIELRWVLQPLTENTTEAVLTVSAELNMMMKMLASGPLQKLTNHQISRLQQIMATL